MLLHNCLQASLIEELITNNPDTQNQPCKLSRIDIRVQNGDGQQSSPGCATETAVSDGKAAAKKSEQPEQLMKKFNKNLFEDVMQQHSPLQYAKSDCTQFLLRRYLEIFSQRVRFPQQSCRCKDDSYHICVGSSWKVQMSDEKPNSSAKFSYFLVLCFLPGWEVVGCYYWTSAEVQAQKTRLVAQGATKFKDTNVTMMTNAMTKNRQITSLSVFARPDALEKCLDVEVVVLALWGYQLSAGQFVSPMCVENQYTVEYIPTSTVTKLYTISTISRAERMCVPYYFDPHTWVDLSLLHVVDNVRITFPEYAPMYLCFASTLVESCYGAQWNLVARPILNPLSTACADLLTPDSYLAHNSCRVLSISLSTEDTLRAAASENFYAVDGSWWLTCVLVKPVLNWYCGVVQDHPYQNTSTYASEPNGMPPQLVLQGVSFAFVALLALDSRCNATFNPSQRKWTLNFANATNCAEALEVAWPPVTYWNNMGIEMVYAHATPGEVTVSLFRPS
jgi:hypothetical protein